MKVISIFDQKGGAGKTPTAVQLSFALAGMGKHVLFIDADPQGTASLHFLGTGYRNQEVTFFNAITSTRNVEQVTHIEPIIVNDCLHLLSAHDELEQAEVLLTSKRSFTWQRQLVKLLALYHGYDFVIVDTPGSRVSIFPTLALVASDIAIVPVKTTLEAQQAMQDSMSLIEDLQQLNSRLVLHAIVPNQFEDTRHHKEIVEILMENYPGKVYEPSRKSIKYSDALARKADIRDLDPYLGEYWDVIAGDLVKLEGGVRYASK